MYFMKSFIRPFFVIMLFAFLILRCTTREYDDPNTTSGIALAIDDFDKFRSNQYTKVRVGDTAMFRDISLHADGRLWVFPEGFVDIIGSNEDTFSDLGQFDAIFKKTGQIEVILKPLFKYKVAEEIQTDTLKFSILPKIVADFTTNIPLINGNYQIQAGKPVSFSNTSSEIVNSEWTVLNKTTQEIIYSSTASNFFQEFDVAGQYKMTLRAFTDAPISEDTKSLEFEILPSTEPIGIANFISENQNGDIEIVYNKRLNNTTLDQVSAFELLVDGVAVPITSIALDPANEKKILIKPSVNIKNSQQAVLSYTPVSLVSMDNLPSPALSNASVLPYIDNIYTNGGFEGIDSPVPGNYFDTHGFLQNDPLELIKISIDPGAGIDDSSAMVFSFPPSSTSDMNRTVFGDGDPDAGSARIVQFIEPIVANTVYIFRAKVKYLGAKPGNLKFTLCPYTFVFEGLVSVDIADGFKEDEFVVVQGELIPNATTAGGISSTIGTGGVGYPFFNVGGVTGASTVIIDSVELGIKEF